MNLIFWAAAMVGGFLIGLGVAAIFWRRRLAKITVGTIREDSSDPTEPPYLFLEMDRGGFDKLHAYPEVMLRVNLQSYIPRE